MKPKITLRHIAVIVNDLRESKKYFEGLGYKEIHREKFQVVKMRNQKGDMFELIKGQFYAHVCVNFYETKSGQYLEVFRHDPGKT